MTGDLSGTLDLAMDRLFRLRGVLDPSEIATGLGMSVSEAMAMRHLAAGEVTQHELGAHLNLEKSTVSRLVDAMVSKGWVLKEPQLGNRRQRTVKLTDEGARTAHAVAQAMHRRHEQVLGALSPEERHALALALPALVRALAEEPDQIGPPGPSQGGSQDGTQGLDPHADRRPAASHHERHG